MKCLLFPIIALFMAGCLSSTPDKYYLLGLDKPANKAPFRLARLELPAYLEQNCLIRRCGANRIEYLEGHSWASGLRHMLKEALDDALEAGSRQAISLRIRRFEAADDGAFHVKIEYTLEKGKGEIAFELPCGTAPDAIVATANQALAELQRRLAAL